MQKAKVTASVLLLLLMMIIQPIDASEPLEPEASSSPSGSLKLDFMPDEIKIEVMQHLPAQSIRNLSATCRSLYKVRSPALKNLIKDLTLNAFLRAADEDISGMPATLITAYITDLMATETFVLLPTDFTSSPENMDALYAPLFGQPILQGQEDLAREHLNAVVTLYRKATVHPTPPPLQILARFLRAYGAQKHLKTLTLLGEEEELQLAVAPHTLVMTDLELSHDELYDKVTHLLSEQDEHHLVVNVGSLVVEEGNWLRVPSNVRHLTLINPKGDITGLGSDFLQGHKNLERLHINLPKVTTIANRMLDNCNKLTHATFFLPALTTLGDCFLRYCFNVRRVDLHIPAIATIGAAFLYQCESL
ncbi:MAG: F-box protein [Holosporales bacterium]